MREKELSPHAFSTCFLHMSHYMLLAPPPPADESHPHAPFSPVCVWYQIRRRNSHAAPSSQGGWTNSGLVHFHLRLPHLRLQHVPLEQKRPVRPRAPPPRPCACLPVLHAARRHRPVPLPSRGGLRKRERYVQRKRERYVQWQTVTDRRARNASARPARHTPEPRRARGREEGGATVGGAVGERVGGGGVRARAPGRLCSRAPP